MDDSQDNEEELPIYPPYDPTLPLPEYTRAWGWSEFLRRPAQLPDEYDKRIDPMHIYVFTTHPITGIQKPYYVTPKPCDYCIKIRQVCSRTRPLCQRCVGTNGPARSCVMDEGFMKLPPPRCSKPNMKKKARGDDKAVPKKARAIAPTPQRGGGAKTKTVSPPTRPPQEVSVEPQAKKRRITRSATSAHVTPPPAVSILPESLVSAISPASSALTALPSPPAEEPVVKPVRQRNVPSAARRTSRRIAKSDQQSKLRRLHQTVTVC